jgi:nuclear migration protein JNM1
MATKRGLASASQQEVFEAAPAGRVAPGPVLRPSDSSLRQAVSADVITPALSIPSARARFGESPLAWDSLGPSRAAENTRLDRLEKLRREAEQLLSEEERNDDAALPPSALRELRALQVRLQEALESRRSVFPVLPNVVPALPEASGAGADREALSEAICTRGVVYEVYADANGEKGKLFPALASLDKRLAAAEAVLGSQTTGKPIAEELQSIQRTVALLSDPSSGDRLRQLLDLLRKVPEAQLGPDASAVKQLWGAVERWDAVADLLPAIVSRLRELRSLHEAAADSANRLQEMQSEQAAMRQLLSQGVELLQSVKIGLEQNNSATLQGLAALNARLDKLQK